MSSQLYPEVLDGSTLGALYSQSIFLPIGIEGQADNAGSGVLGAVYSVDRPSVADDYFGPSSSLATLAKFVLDRGVAPVYATISKKGTAPILTERQAAWAFLESDSRVRIRLTDSVTQADLVALADSCENASLINNKQFAVMGMASATSKASLLTAATAIQSKRGLLVAPGVYDEGGTLISGAYAAAAVAAEVAKNADPSDDLDLVTLPGLLDIEHDSAGTAVFRIKVVSGSPVNDFEDLLQGGVSPLQPGRNGGVEISHLRMAYTTDDTFDALQTRIIVDQIFVLVREYAFQHLFLRKGNTATNRALLQSGVEALLRAHSDWISPITQSDGVLGYATSVTASSDERQMIVSYQGKVVRGVQTISVDGRLEIPV